MNRNVMNKEKAEALAKKLVKRKMSAFGGPHTMAVTLGEKTVMTDAAFKKVRKAFLERVIRSESYKPLEKIYAKGQLTKMEKANA